MNIIFLHGPPAAGKYTIAKELEKQAGYGVFHNHLTIDVARAFFEFGTEEFWSFVDELRHYCVSNAAQRSEQTVVYTSCYDHPNDLAVIEELERLASTSSGFFLPVYLSCDHHELERRVSDPSRVSMQKIRSVEGLHACLKKWNCIPYPATACITIHTKDKGVLACAEEIIRHVHATVLARDT